MKSLSNSKGQMAIFLALIFQILFVFFAMCINIALVVYDKINLQNSVDLASYYGATKQAEVLNVIAHINYQIRQNYKLLAWRYNHLGVATVLTPKEHPVKDPLSYKISDLRDLENLGFFNSGEKLDSEGKAISGINSLCLSGPQLWTDSPRAENYCKNISQQISVPGTNVLPDSDLIGIKKHFAGAVKEIQRSCGKISYLNLWFIAHVLYARFFEDSRKKMRLIHSLVNRILIPFKDLNENHISAGMRHVFYHNLSYRNRRNVDRSSIEYINSLHGKSFQSLFKEIQALFSLAYARPKILGNEQKGVKCEYQYKILTGGANQEKEITTAVNQILFGSSPQFGKQIQDIINTKYPFMGIEKNPKQVVFTGFRAKVSLNNTIFTPLIKEQLYQAESFAKPFGGQIGPYYSKNNYGVYYERKDQKTDPLGPRRVSEEDQSSFKITDGDYSLANHSKYPGDKLGLTSYASYLSMNLFANPGVVKFQVKDYAAAAYFENPDPVVCNHYSVKKETKLNQLCGAKGYQDKAGLFFPRKMELIAIAPDLFDITYYSIENDFKNNYFKKVQRIAYKYLPDEQIPLADLGTTYEGLLQDLRINPNNHWSIRDQIELVHSSKDVFATSHNRVTQFYKISQPQKILTSWVNFVAPYAVKPNSFPGTVDELTSIRKRLSKTKSSSFQRCFYPKRSITAVIQNPERKEDLSNPGDCIIGGRSGYSAKIFHKSLYGLPQWLPSY